LVGLFLATLELVRHHGVRLEQGDLFEEIWILPGDSPTSPLDLAPADNNQPSGESTNTPAAAEQKSAAKAKPPRKKKAPGVRQNKKSGTGD
jgi:hypothetical protein